MSSRGLQRFEMASAPSPWARSRGVARRDVSVGKNALFFDVNETLAAEDKLDEQFSTLRGDLLRVFGGVAGLASGAAAAHPAQWQWIQLVFQPQAQEWTAIYTHGKQMPRDTPFGVARGDWALIEDWHKRLLDLRAGARAHGFSLTTPEPDPLPTTRLDDVEDAAKQAVSGLGTIAKVAIAGGVGLGVIFLGTQIASSVRSAHTRGGRR